MFEKKMKNFSRLFFLTQKKEEVYFRRYQILIFTHVSEVKCF
jgi:hypothetical protein